MLTEKDNAVQANAMETAVPADVLDRIFQKLAGLDKARWLRAEKYIELLLAEKAALTGDAEAQAKCGDMYMSGNGEDILVSQRMAHHWYMEAAKQGHVRSQLLCGEYYYNRYYPIRDSARAALLKAEALQWYEKAAEQGNAQAQFCCGNMYYRGEGMDEPDFEKAFYWYEKAAEQGHPHAQYALGGMYEDYRTEDDDKKAFYWYLQSAQQGYDEAQVIVGSLYERGDGTDVDYQKALYWYEKAAEQGHDHGVVACA
ncbi:MAG: tetratricopeptide repeat protein, partial [Segatella copri]